ncbi:MAG TPA: hypothetical protein RMI62_33270, partial [Polyangiaceae bacterium LLY-WYZ-15_(1-7)]|nr:hypothetical protein [Polyangiaceae bacterium LLY-WYZ-15_(1-7)]
KAAKAAQARLEEARGHEKRALETVLSRLGGKDALEALLEGIVDDPGAARKVTHELKAQVKAADGNARRSMRAQLERFLKARKRDEAAAPARAATLKVLGFLEDARTVPVLLAHAKDPKEAPEARQEALIALRFALASGKKPDAKIVNALRAAAEAEDRQLAQTAVLTLATLPLTKKLAETFVALAAHADIHRAHLAIRRLATEADDAATEALAEIVAGRDEQRAQLALDALKERREAGLDDGTGALVDALVAADEGRRVQRLRQALRPVAGELTAAQKKTLLKGAAKMFADGRVGWREVWELAGQADAKATAKALRAEVAKARKGRKKDAEEALLRVLSRVGAEPEERYRLASLLLGRSKLDTRKAARRSDEALKLLATLDREDFDVVAALRKDRSAGLEVLYYVGFHFVEEEGTGAGEELLEEVAKKGGRKKIAKAAKNKLKLVR